MTLRVLLQKLHAAAAEFGADMNAEVRGLSKRVEVLNVKTVDDVAVIQVGYKLSRVEKENRQLGYARARYKRLKAAGLCTRCKTPTDGKAECAKCASIGSIKRVQRYLNSRRKITSLH